MVQATVANQFKEGQIPILNEELCNNNLEYFDHQDTEVYKKYTIKSKKTRGKNKI